jgi:molybdate transport system substrate-binding protein
MLWVFPGACGSARSAELVIITGQGTTPGVKEVVAAFASKSGHKVTVAQEDGPALDQRLAAGGQADLIASSPVQIADLVKRGKVAPDSVTPFVMAGLGLSVRAGLPKPDISTVEAYKAALIAAKSIGYSRGCSGTNAADGIVKLGLADQLKAKTVLTTNGPVTDYLARGDIDLGIQQTNIMVGVAGTDYVGALPGFLNKPCPSSLALMAGTKQIEAARAMMQFMLSGEAAPLLRKTFVEPIKS